MSLYVHQPARRLSLQAKIITSVAAYLLGIFLTFGWVYNHTPTTYWVWSADKHPDSQREMLSAFDGIVWPIYWAGRAALVVTVWP